MAVVRLVEGSEGLTPQTGKLFKDKNKSSNDMVEKGNKAAKSRKKGDALPYISPERKVIKAKLRNIYSAEPI